MSKRILIADDDADIRAFMATALEAAGHGTLEAGDGVEALRLSVSGDVSLILLDMGMPGLPGDAVARILGTKGAGAPPVVFVTARSTPRERADGLEMGALDYIVKPFEPEELVARVERALERAQQA